MSQNNVLAFRVNVPNSTTAIAPLILDLQAMSSALKRVTMFTSAGVDFSKCGFRLRNHTNRLIPDIGSDDNIGAVVANEDVWAPLTNSPIEINFDGKDLIGAPFLLSLDFYNITGAAINVGGFIVTSMPELSLREFLLEYQRYNMQARPITYDKQVIETKQSNDPVYPVQQQGKK